MAVLASERVECPEKKTKHSYGDIVDAPLLPDDQQQLPPQRRRRSVIRTPASMHAQLPRPSGTSTPLKKCVYYWHTNDNEKHTSVCE